MPAIFSMHRHNGTAARIRLPQAAASVATGALLLAALAPAHAQSGQEGAMQQPYGAQPFIAVTYTPAQPVAGQSFRTSWRSGSRDNVSFSCTAPGTGYNYANDVGTGAGYFDQVAQPGWVGKNATCVWTADNGELTASVTMTLVTVAAPSTPAPTLSVARNPNPMTAGASYTLSWRTTDTGSISRVCTASAGGFTANDAPTATGGSENGTASASWVDKPSNCTWTASGPGGITAVTETMTTQAAATTPAPTLSVSRTPNPMTAGASYTLNWSANGATSISRVCTSSGGYTVNDAPTATGGSTSGTASASWVGRPSNCTWTATGAGGSTAVTETMTTQAAVDDGITYIHTDSLGSPVARSNSRGEIISRTRYEPYGLTAAGATPTIGFTGHVNDADTGLVYMQQRYYDPIAGRMLSIDPVTTDANTGGSFNRYAYAENNPYKYIDPDGRSFVDAAFLAVDLYRLGSAVVAGEGVGAALVDVGISAVGVVSPVPLVGEAWKGIRAAEKVAEVARGAEKGAEAAKTFKVTKTASGKRIEDYTAAQKKAMKSDNAAAHGGTMTCEKCGKQLENVKSEKGVPTPDNQAHVHHTQPIQNGGTRATPGEVLCPACHRIEHQ